MTEPAIPETSSTETPVTLPPNALGRLFDLYRETGRSRTALALLVANAIPLVGVVLLGWSLWTILVIYWVENGIVGFWNVPRILLAEGQLLPGRRPGMGYRGWAVQSMPAAGRAGLALFFTVHYGLFWLVHGVFVLVLPSFMGFVGGPGSQGPPVWLFPGDPGFPGDAGLPGVLIPNNPVSPGVEGPASLGPFGTLDWGAVGLATVGLFLSHGASFAFNYLGRGEFRRSWAAAQMVAPYGRVVVLHVTILLGGFGIAFLGAPLVTLLLLVLLKTALDLAGHLREHGPQLAMPPAA